MSQARLPDIFPPDYSGVTTADWQRWRADALARFTDLLGTGPARRSPADHRVESEIREDGHIRQLISYPIDTDDTGWAWLLRPEGVAGPRPGVIVLHGTVACGKDASLQIGPQSGGTAGMAVHLVKRGFVVMAPDHFCAGQRTPKSGQAYNTSEFYARHPDWSEMGKHIFDTQQALDVLLQVPAVDQTRIGCIGHSLGGYGTVFFAAMDERVKAAVSSCGITSWHCDPNRNNWSRTAPGAYKHFPRLRRYFDAGQPPPIDIYEVMATIAPRALLNLSAVGNDACFPVFEPFADIYVQVERVYKALKAEGKFACYLHSEKHSFNASPRALAYTWLQEQLGLAGDIRLA